MEITIFLARFWGWLLLILSLILLVRKKKVVDIQFQLVKDKSFLLFSGEVALMIGLVTVIIHNVWVADWRVVITIFGWISLIKGVMRMGFPEMIQQIIPIFKDKPGLIRSLLVVTLLLGSWLVWMSYSIAV